MGPSLGTLGYSPKITATTIQERDALLSSPAPRSSSKEQHNSSPWAKAPHTSHGKLHVNKKHGEPVSAIKQSALQRHRGPRRKKTTTRHPGQNRRTGQNHTRLLTKVAHLVTHRTINNRNHNPASRSCGTNCVTVGERQSAPSARAETNTWRT